MIAKLERVLADLDGKTKSDTKVRLDAGLHRALAEAAQRRGVSLNAEITARLEVSLKLSLGTLLARPTPPAAAPDKPSVDDHKTAAELELRAENAQLREMISSRRRTGTLRGKLTARKIAELVKQAQAGKLTVPRHGDGGNLWLQIANNSGAASWIFRWTDRQTGEERTLGLGSLQDVDLDLARERAHQGRLLLDEGKDPKTERESVRLDIAIAAGLAKTVSQVADEYFEQKISHRSLTYRKQTLTWLKTYVHDTIGPMPIQKVDRKAILETVGLRKLWTSQNPTALALQNHLDRIFKLAIACKYYVGENPAAWEGLQHVLPASADVHRREHHPSLPYKDVGRFMEAVRAYEDTRVGHERRRTTVSFAVEFIVLTGVRRNEVVLAQWKEFDLQSETPVPPKVGFET